MTSAVPIAMNQPAADGAGATRRIAQSHLFEQRLFELSPFGTLPNAVASVHEWPFDHSTLLRVGVYVLIPAAPSLGQIAMRFVMEHFAP